LVALAAAAIVGGLHGLNFLLEAERTPARFATARPHVARAPASPVVDPASGSRGTTRRLCLPKRPPDSVTTCGLSPATRRADGGTAYRVTTVAGETLWVVLPDDGGRMRRVVAVPHAPIGWLGEPDGSEPQITTAPSADAAARFCEAARACEPTAVTSKALANGTTLTGWRLRPAGRRVEVVTLQMGIWVLALREDIPQVTEFIAGLLRWRLEGGFLLLDSPDPTYPIYEDWAGVRIAIAGDGAPYSLTVTPGCGLSEKRPDVGRPDARPRLQLHRRGGVPGGEWCSGRRYWVEARNLEGASLERLHEGIEILPDGPDLRFATEKGPW
jgi:hypothetical protein